MQRFTLCLMLTISLLVLFVQPLLAMDGGYGEFQQLMHTPIRILTEKADRILSQKYENSSVPLFGAAPTSIDSLLQGLPDYATVNATVRVAYRIAIKKPELLTGYEIYSETKPALRNLLYCFLKDGKKGTFTDLAAGSQTCTSEAILIFLWTEMGAAPGDISAALRLLFDPSVHEPPPMTP